MSEHRKLFLLDAMALIYRAYFALNKNPRINSKGLNTSAILGFANTLVDVIKNEKPTHIGVAFDTMAPTFRHDDFIHYKANREAMPEDLAISIPLIKQLIEAFNIPILYVDGYEADDVIGTLAKKAEKEGFKVYMMTPDKDFGQLVSENIFIYKPAKFGNKAEVHGVKEVCERFNIKRPEQVKDILGLWGDASDNIPGIPGIGEVTAKKLIEEYETIENLIENADKLKDTLKIKVKEHSKQALMSKQLASIILDVPIELEEENLIINEPNKEKLSQLLDFLEFRTFAKRVFEDTTTVNEPIAKTKNTTGQITLFGDEQDTTEDNNLNKITINDVDHKYYLVTTFEERQNLINQLLKQKSFCFDTETSGLETVSSDLIGISFSFKPHVAYYVVIPDNIEDAKRILNEFRIVFENDNIEKSGQNMKFDISMLKAYDIKIKGKLFDTMLAHYLLQPDMRHNMDVLAENYLNYSPVSIETLIGKKGVNQKSMKSVPIEILKEYACEDADITLQLKNIFETGLNKDKSINIFNEIEIPLIDVLSSMELNGVKIDTNALKEYSVELLSEIKAIEKEIFELAGIQFNIASPKQLGEVLFDKLKIVEKAKLTKTKQYSTGEEILIKLVGKHPIIQKILDYRSLTKLKSTYVDSLPELINKKTGLIHTSYNQAVAATGRLSSNNPNLQNIPIRTERGREIRKSFVPRNEDFLILSADYSQIELRIIAELSKDEGMLESFLNGVDIHTATASKVFNVPLNEVTKDMRRNAKTVNFGIVYGISSFGLSERVNIPRKESANIIEQYFNKYPGIKTYMEKTIDFARKNGFVETILGRRRYINDINSSNAIVRGYAERNAINAPIQGTAADMIKIAMINIHKAINENGLKTKMIMQVHDELVFDVHKTEIDVVKTIVSDKMKKAIEMKVPIEVEVNTGENWLMAH